jgi:uncharacterized membrane protein
VVGTVTEGDETDPENYRARAQRWTTTTGYEDLGALPGGESNTYASAISGDGLSVTGGSGGSLFLWTGESGMLDLNTYLATQGVDLTGWVLTEATGLSYDGSVIVGNGYFNGQPRGWIASVPEPATLWVMSLGILLVGRRHTRHWASSRRAVPHG